MFFCLAIVMQGCIKSFLKNNIFELNVVEPSNNNYHSSSGTIEVEEQLKTVESQF